MPSDAWRYRRYWRTDLMIAAVLIAVSLVFSYPPLDLRISEAFYCGGGKATGWPVGQQFPWRALYYLPPVAVGMIVATCLVYLALSYMHVVNRRYRIHCGFLLGALWLGSALVCEGILKMNWGRPRPCEISHFDGCLIFVKALSRGVRGCGKSFPSGHSAVGYYLSAFYFLFRRSGRWRPVAIVAGSLAAGALVAIARIAAGAHFASDVAWSCSIVFTVNLVLYYFVINVPAHEDGLRVPTLVRSKRSTFIMSTLLTIICLELIVYAAAPVHEGICYRSEYLVQGPKRGTLRLAVTNCAITLNFCQSGPLRIEGHALGYGLPGAAFDVQTEHRHVSGTRQVEFTCAPRGHFYRINSAFVATIPLDGVGRLILDAEDCKVHLGVSSLPPEDIVLTDGKGQLILGADSARESSG